jgi:hypothetical protein
MAVGSVVENLAMGGVPLLERRSWENYDMREHTERQAADVAYSLGIKIYLANGRISTRPGGKEFDPGPRSRPLQDHGSVKSDDGSSGG